MKAYEFSAKITPDGKLELPDVQLEDLSHKSTVRIIVLIEEMSPYEADEEDEDDEDDEDDERIESAVESFRKSWYQAKQGQRIPLAQLWEGIETDAE